MAASVLVLFSYLFTIEVYINIYLRLYTTIFHNSEKLQILFSAYLNARTYCARIKVLVLL